MPVINPLDLSYLFGRLCPIGLALCLALSALHTASLAAQEVDEDGITDKRQPLIEVGAGLFATSYSDYPGSDHHTSYLVPYPKVVYRGKYLRATRSGLRGLLYNGKRVEVDISTGGSLPVKSEDNDVREGMPDLGPSFELGPSLRLKLLQSDNDFVQFRLDSRALIDVNEITKWDYEGWVINPNLRWYHFFSERVDTMVMLQARHGDARYNNYFYGVAPQYVTAERPAYEADAGYGGFATTFTLRWRPNPDWALRASVKYHDLNNVEFDDSPLFVRDKATYYSFSISRTLWRSKTRVSYD